MDLIFNIKNENRILPTVSERQKNRLQLKHNMLKEFWNEDIIMENTSNNLEISDEIKEKLNKNHILVTDILKVIANSEESNMKFHNLEKDTFTGYLQIGNMTYWAEYRILQNNNFELVNGYCHRMKIEI